MVCKSNGPVRFSFIREVFMFQRLLAAVCIIMGFAQAGYATTITYTVQNIGANLWQYDYTITNDTLGIAIDELSIHFTYGSYESIAVSSSPSDWDVLEAQPDDIFGAPDDGFVDALALVSGIAPGSTLSGLSVRFNWLGDDAPGSQYFEVLAPDIYDVLDSGSTTPASSSPVPEPATLLLFGSGLAGLAGIRKKFKA
jgi:hypothetical protein